MIAITDKRIIIHGPTNPFPVWDEWDFVDGMVEAVVAEGNWIPLLPFGDPRLELKDAFVNLFTEAWRVLEPNGTLTIKCPWALNPHYGLGRPEQKRLVTQNTFLAFGCPAENYQQYDWHFGGKDYGTRFVIIFCETDAEMGEVGSEIGSYVTCILRKPAEGEFGG